MAANRTEASQDTQGRQLVGFEIDRRLVRAVVLTPDGSDILAYADSSVMEPGTHDDAFPNPGPAISSIWQKLQLSQYGKLKVGASFGFRNAGVGSGELIGDWIAAMTDELSEPVDVIAHNDGVISYAPKSHVDIVRGAFSGVGCELHAIELAPVSVGRMLPSKSSGVLTIGSGVAWRVRLHGGEILEAMPYSGAVTRSGVHLEYFGQPEQPLGSVNHVEVPSGLLESQKLTVGMLAVALGVAVGLLEDSSTGNFQATTEAGSVEAESVSPDHASGQSGGEADMAESTEEGTAAGIVGATAVAGAGAVAVGLANADQETDSNDGDVEIESSLDSDEASNENVNDSADPESDGQAPTSDEGELESETDVDNVANFDVELADGELVVDDAELPAKRTDGDSEDLLEVDTKSADGGQTVTEPETVADNVEAVDVDVESGDVDAGLVEAESGEAESGDVDVDVDVEAESVEAESGDVEAESESVEAESGDVDVEAESGDVEAGLVDVDVEDTDRSVAGPGTGLELEEVAPAAPGPPMPSEHLATENFVDGAAEFDPNITTSMPALPPPVSPTAGQPPQPDISEEQFGDTVGAQSPSLGAHGILPDEAPADELMAGDVAVGEVSADELMVNDVAVGELTADELMDDDVGVGELADDDLMVSEAEVDQVVDNGLSINGLMATGQVANADVLEPSERLMVDPTSSNGNDGPQRVKLAGWGSDEFHGKTETAQVADDLQVNPPDPIETQPVPPLDGIRMHQPPAGDVEEPLPWQSFGAPTPSNGAPIAPDLSSSLVQPRYPNAGVDRGFDEVEPPLSPDVEGGFEPIDPTQTLIEGVTMEPNGDLISAPPVPVTESSEDLEATLSGSVLEGKTDNPAPMLSEMAEEPEDHEWATRTKPEVHSDLSTLTVTGTVPVEKAAAHLEAQLEAEVAVSGEIEVPEFKSIQQPGPRREVKRSTRWWPYLLVALIFLLAVAAAGYVWQFGL